MKNSCLVVATCMGMGLLAEAPVRGDGLRWVRTSAVGPPGGEGNRIAYDSARHVTVSMGGSEEPCDQGGCRSQTWELVAGVWTKRTVVGPVYSRSKFALAYDASRGVVVVHGGEGRCGGHTCWLGDTWEYNGAAWTQRQGSSPSGPRTQPGMAFDSARGASVLFGGWSGNAVHFYSDTWEWNGSAWTQRATTGPSERVYPEMAYDPVREVVVLHGGYGPYGSGAALADTWEWNGTAWTLRATGGAPASYDSGMAYDAALGLTILCPRDRNETWAWNGSVWTQLVIPGPGARHGHTMAYDAALGAVVLFAGVSAGSPASNLNDTWLLVPNCADFNNDGDAGTDQDIEAFFRCLAGNCCPICPATTDFNGDGDIGTDADIEAFFRVLAGGNC